MKNNYKFFQNKTCRFYPCHSNISKPNCIFCFCPLFNTEECIVIKILKGKNKKSVCESCSFPHIAHNYDIIIRKLRKLNEKIKKK